MKKLIKRLPDTPGVYIFRGVKRKILYIGKATSLRTRVASYFRRDLMETRGPIITGMVEAAQGVDFVATDSVLEALILEAALIKKHQPPYNTKEKSDKSFNYVVITKEEFPRVLIVRGRELKNRLSTFNFPLLTYFGPFPQGSVLREALSLVRKIFPFRDKCLPTTAYRSDGAVRRWQAGVPNSGKPCFNAQIGLCPGVCAGKISRIEYSRTIRHIKLFFEGEKQVIVRSLERDMKKAAKAQRFEEAARIKRTVFALNHIQDIALLKADVIPRTAFGRIEAYDVAHTSGANTVGVMVVVEEGEAKKSDYRKFKIKSAQGGDTTSLHEIIRRRFEHTEWQLPKLIVVDGGKAQVNVVEKALKEWGLAIPVIGVVKDEHHRPREILDLKKVGPLFDRAILLANGEAHRFAIAYHRTLRGKLK